MAARYATLETLTISDSSFSGNSADRRGGAIYNFGEANISGSSFSGNFANYGGGGAIANWGEASISDSSFSDNYAFYRRRRDCQPGRGKHQRQQLQRQFR